MSSESAREAAVRNRRDDVTGLLLFNSRRFLQVLEGPKDAVERIFARIYDDSRHRGVVKLREGAIVAREFGQWAMAYDDPCRPSGNLKDMVAAARARWPEHSFEVRDVVADPLEAESVDVAIMNGVLTERQSIPRERMVDLAEGIVAAAFRAARYGVAFNAMSKHVDWERDDLFHWGFDEVAAFLKRDLTRHMAFRADYGLYEFTAFAWREPQRPAPLAREDWWKR